MAKTKSKYASPGQPTLYKDEYCHMLIEHMREGFSYESFAGVIESDRTTLYNWEKSNSEFFHAKKRGMDLCLLYWERAGKKGMFASTIYEDGKKISETKLQSAIWIFNMKARFKWFDVPEKDILQIPPGADKRQILLHAKEAIKLLEEDIKNEESQLQTIEVKQTNEEKVQDGKASEKL